MSVVMVWGGCNGAGRGWAVQRAALKRGARRGAAGRSWWTSAHQRAVSSGVGCGAPKGPRCGTGRRVALLSSAWQCGTLRGGVDCTRSARAPAAGDVVGPHCWGLRCGAVRCGELRCGARPSDAKARDDPGAYTLRMPRPSALQLRCVLAGALQQPQLSLRTLRG